MEMNLPNKLTIFRVVLIPFFVAVLMTNCLGDNSKWVALVIFVIASLTDLLDGKIARNYNLVTTFGKFADPLADKILVIDGGRIAAVGTHKELLNNSDIYREIHTSQNNGGVKFSTKTLQHVGHARAKRASNGVAHNSGRGGADDGR